MSDAHHDVQHVNVLSELKAHARILHRAAQAADPAALQRLRVLPELKRKSDAELVAELKRHKCLAAVAKRLGFTSWVHATLVLGDEAAPEDFGSLLYPDHCTGHWNIWSAAYDEAQTIRAAHGGYLLVYRKQFFIADQHFIEALGLDPADPDWERMGRDWAKPRDAQARQRLYLQLIHNTLVTWVLQTSTQVTGSASSATG